MRRCEPKGIFGVHCKSESQGDDSTMVCTCDSDNCNKDDQCTCKKPSPTPDPNGLKCQVCGDGVGECQDANDNGESKTCPTNAGEQVCLYVENRKITYYFPYTLLHKCITDTADKSAYMRRCEPKSVFGVHCVTENEGDVSSMVCTCDSDNCNMADGCTCEHPAPTSTSSTSTSSTPTSTSANSSSSIGVSFILIAFILVLLGMQ